MRGPRLLGVLALVVTTAACGARAEVRTPTDVPVLQPATPPERIIVPAPERPTLPDPEAAPPAGPPAPARPRGSQPPARQVLPPPPVLSTTANTADFERRIRDQVRQAEADLSQVNRAKLGANARAQYDAARGFIRQCEEALTVRNLIFASQLADKAATMAALLRR